MTIEEERVVDFIGHSRKHGTKILFISDHLEWADYEHHSMSLQGKINYYLEYIYSGSSREAEPRENNVRIHLVMKHEPTAQAAMLLKRIEADINNLGFEFVHSVFDEEEKPGKDL